LADASEIELTAYRVAALRERALKRVHLGWDQIELLFKGGSCDAEMGGYVVAGVFDSAGICGK